MSHHDSECVVAQVGSPAPDFTMASTRNLETLNQSVSLADYKGKWLVMFFYPLDFTLVCPTEIVAFSDAASKFRAAGAEILGVSVDSQFTHRAWIKTPRDKNGLGELNFPLAADITKKVSRKYGVLLRTRDRPARPVHRRSRKGMMQYAVVHTSASAGASTRPCASCRFQTGELCPANWKPGSATLKP